MLISVLLFMAGASGASVAFAGSWVGSYTNTSGETGADRLTLSEDASGAISGDWAGMAVAGRRLNDNTLEIWGSTAKRSYQGTGSINGGVLTIRYNASRLDSSGSYQGTSVFRRP